MEIRRSVIARPNLSRRSMEQPAVSTQLKTTIPASSRRTEGWVRIAECVFFGKGTGKRAIPAGRFLSNAPFERGRRWRFHQYPRKSVGGKSCPRTLFRGYWWKRQRLPRSNG